MFVRAKKSGAYEYLQLVHNERVDGKVRQQVIATPGSSWVPACVRSKRFVSRCWLTADGINRCTARDATVKTPPP